MLQASEQKLHLRAVAQERPQVDHQRSLLLGPPPRVHRGRALPGRRVLVASRQWILVGRARLRRELAVVVLGPLLRRMVTAVRCGHCCEDKGRGWSVEGAFQGRLGSLGTADTIPSHSLDLLSCFKVARTAVYTFTWASCYLWN